MTESGNADSTAGASVRKPHSRLRAVLLACVAGLGIAAALGGPIAGGHTGGPYTGRTPMESSWT
jgi:hypothetical protein